MQTAERGQPPTINTADSSSTQSGVNIQSGVEGACPNGDNN